MFLAGGVVVVGTGAYVSGALDPLLAPSPASSVADLPAETAGQSAAVTPAQETTPKQDRTDQKPAADAQPATDGQQAAGEKPADAAQQAGAPAETAKPAEEPAGTEKPAEAEQSSGQSEASGTKPADEPAVEGKPADQPAAQPAVEPPAQTQESGQTELAAVEPQSSTAPAGEQKPAAEAQPAAEAPKPGVPTFDVVRVEADGSVVIAGKASPNAKVDLLSGGKVIGSTVASASGDFVVILDEPLKPGDYQVTISATNPDSTTAASAQTAIISIPNASSGQVLAMVEEPGKPSNVITAPQATSEAQAPASETQAPAGGEQAAGTAEGTAAGGQGETSSGSAAVASVEPKPGTQASATAAPTVDVAVEAVEIEGTKMFVAGHAPAGSTVRVYVNEDRLGDAKTSPVGRFLVEAQRDLAVGTYMIRADVLGPDGAKVVGRAVVPFEREPGENVAAVAAAEAPAAEPQAQQASDATTQSGTAGSGEQAAAGTNAAPENAAPPPEPAKPAEDTTAQQATQPKAEEPAKPADDAAGQAAASADAKKPAEGQAVPVATSSEPVTGEGVAPAATAEAGKTATDTNAGQAAASTAQPAAGQEEQSAAEQQPAATATQQPPATEPEAPATQPAETATAPALKPVANSVIIRRGDNLWRISKRVYGRGVRYSTIYLANRSQIRDPDLIWPGQIFSVPDKTEQGEAADMSKMGDQAVPAAQ